MLLQELETSVAFNYADMLEGTDLTPRGQHIVEDGGGGNGAESAASVEGKLEGLGGALREAVLESRRLNQADASWLRRELTGQADELESGMAELGNQLGQILALLQNDDAT